MQAIMIQNKTKIVQLPDFHATCTILPVSPVPRLITTGFINT